jgi:hypothetical protein
MAVTVIGVARASRLPLVVFQHHHNHHHYIYDEQDSQQQEESVAQASDNHHFPRFNSFDDGSDIRVLYQVGVSTLTFAKLKLNSVA